VFLLSSIAIIWTHLKSKTVNHIISHFTQYLSLLCSNKWQFFKPVLCPWCVYLLVCLYVDVDSSELSFNLLALCLQCVCLFIYIRINPNILEKLLGIEQV